MESAAGVQAGGRTGLTALTVAALFLLALLFSPLAAMVPAYATAPALIYVAGLMLRELVHLDWSDVTEAMPASLAALGIAVHTIPSPTAWRWASSAMRCSSSAPAAGAACTWRPGWWRRCSCCVTRCSATRAVRVSQDVLARGVVHVVEVEQSGA